MKLQTMFEDKFDLKVRDKLSALNAKKMQAVDKEDFDSAIQLKEVIDKLKLVGNDIFILDQKKQEAIRGEDFETAKALKMQLEKL